MATLSRFCTASLVECETTSSLIFTSINQKFYEKFCHRSSEKFGESEQSLPELTFEITHYLRLEITLISFKTIRMIKYSSKWFQFMVIVYRIYFITHNYFRKIKKNNKLILQNWRFGVEILTILTSAGVIYCSTCVQGIVTFRYSINLRLPVLWPYVRDN